MSKLLLFVIIFLITIFIYISFLALAFLLKNKNIKAQDLENDID